MRLGKTILRKKVEILASLYGKKFGYEEGNWYLDHNAIYGGYMLVEIMESGGENPIIHARMSAREMANALDMAIALAMKNNK